MSKNTQPVQTIHILLGNTTEDQLDKDTCIQALSKVIRDSKGQALTIREMENRCTFDEHGRFMDGTFRIPYPTNFTAWCKQIISGLQTTTSAVIIVEGGYRGQYEVYKHVGGARGADVDTMIENFVREINGNILKSFVPEAMKK